MRNIKDTLELFELYLTRNPNCSLQDAAAWVDSVHATDQAIVEEFVNNPPELSGNYRPLREFIEELEERLV